MSYPTFPAQVRDEFGGKAAQRYRAAGKVPVTVATSGGESIHLVIDEKDGAVVWGLFGRVVVLEVDGVSHQVLVKGGDKHPIEDYIQIIDVLAVADDKVVKVDVAVIPDTRNCPGIKAGGLLEQMLRKVTIKIEAGKIPDSVGVSLDGVNIEQSVLAESLELPAGAVLITKPKTALMTVIKTRGMRRAEAVAGTEEEA